MKIKMKKTTCTLTYAIERDYASDGYAIENRDVVRYNTTEKNANKIAVSEINSIGGTVLKSETKTVTVIIEADAERFASCGSETIMEDNTNEKD